MAKLLAVLVGLTLLIGGGVAVALMTSSDVAIAQDEAVTDTTVAPEVATEDTVPADEFSDEQAAPARTDRARSGRGDILSGVLDELVADGTITQDQADEITALATERTAELREELRAQRGERGEGANETRALRFLGSSELLDDGVIDADELAGLGEDHLLNDPEGPAAQYLDDGQITEEELTELMAELRGNFGDSSRGAPGSDEDTTEG